jgi:formate dehydrogenase beta subunit
VASNPSATGPANLSLAKRVHPGAGRRKAPLFPKGRVLRTEELDATRTIIGQGPYERPLLIEYLHKIQDAERCLTAASLHALAELMRLPMAEVYEVASSSPTANKSPRR